MNEEMFNRLSSMLNQNKNTSNASFSSNSEFFNNTNNNSFSDNNGSFDFTNIDMETIIKIKNIMSKMSSNQSNPRSNLLRALKPYLKEERKEKLEQYMKFINMASILESFNEVGDNK